MPDRQKGIPATVQSFSPTRSPTRSRTRSPTFRKIDLYPGRSTRNGTHLPGMEGPPEKRRTFRENGLWHGRSPGKAQDLPGKWLLAWKVPRKSAGPSGKMAPSMEGPPEKRRTFRKNDPFPGRFPRWGGSRPPKVPFWWMAKGKGPFIHQKSHFGGWRRREAGRGGMRRHATPG